jgi:hypothetical protein
MDTKADSTSGEPSTVIAGRGAQNMRSAELLKLLQPLPLPKHNTYNLAESVAQIHQPMCGAILI